MTWRVVQIGEQQWNVTVAAERRAHRASWDLVLAFRPVPQGRAVWAPFPLQADSKATLYARAEAIRDEQLAAVLRERLAETQLTP